MLGSAVAMIRRTSATAEGGRSGPPSQAGTVRAYRPRRDSSPTSRHGSTRSASRAAAPALNSAASSTAVRVASPAVRRMSAPPSSASPSSAAPPAGPLVAPGNVVPVPAAPSAIRPGPAVLGAIVVPPRDSSDRMAAIRPAKDYQPDRINEHRLRLWLRSGSPYLARSWHAGPMSAGIGTER